MRDFFFACTILGSAILILQVVLGFFGFDQDLDIGEAEGGDVAGGLELLSVRALSAGAAFYGVGGLGLQAAGLPDALAAAAALVPGALATIGTAFLTRQLLRLESDGSLRLERAVGAAGTVYLTVPGAGEGQGRIQFQLQGRTVELRAVTAEREPIPTGAPVIVVGVVDGDTVEVVPTSTVRNVLHDDR